MSYADWAHVNRQRRLRDAAIVRHAAAIQAQRDFVRGLWGIGRQCWDLPAYWRWRRRQRWV